MSKSDDMFCNVVQNISCCNRKLNILARGGGGGKIQVDIFLTIFAIYYIYDISIITLKEV